MRGFKINENITKHTSGKPFDTEIVVLNEVNENKSEIKYLKKVKEDSFVYQLEKNDIVYGLGENVRGMNKRGWIYESFCSDDFSHTSNKRSLYGAHNFLLVYGKETFGVFVDHPGKVVFDVGYTDKNKLEIQIPNEDFNIYIIEGKTLNEIIKNFRELIGQSYIAPKWAFGYQQSRWSYKDKNELMEVYNKFKENNIPLDCIYLDIDYMDEFKDFTLNEEAFPEFEKIVKELKDDGVRLIPIIDAGVKVKKGYDVYEEGIEKEFFCTDKEDKPFLAAVWPGKVHFPDFLNKDVRKWFGEKYRFLIEKGIEGFWNDMNEPAIFYSQKRLDEAIDKVDSFKGKNLDVYSFFELKNLFQSLSNNIDDYKSFYHNVDGKKVNHYDIHNIYGYNMTRAASEGFSGIDTNKRFLLFSRASSIGAHRYGGIWTGDNTSWWEHLELNIKMMPSLNMCGFLYTGADTGGFSDNCTGDLLTRWFEFSIFTPLFRNHAAMGTRNQEPYQFEDETKNNMRDILSLRYALIPYIYSEYMKSALYNEMYFKPLTFEYDDEFLGKVEDQLLVGDSLMIAPVYKQNSLGRYVYLPEKMLMWKASKFDHRHFEVLEKGHSYIDLEINETPIFIRKDKMLVMTKPSLNVNSLNTEELDLVAFVDKEARYTLYDDDGVSKSYKNGEFNELEVIVTKLEDDYKVTVNKKGNSLIKKLNLNVFNLNGDSIAKEILIR